MAHRHPPRRYHSQLVAALIKVTPMPNALSLLTSGMVLIWLMLLPFEAASYE